MLTKKHSDRGGGADPIKDLNGDRSTGIFTPIVYYILNVRNSTYLKYHNE